MIWKQYDSFPAVFNDDEGIIRLGFQLSSFTMSLILAYKVNKGYERWRDALAGLTGVGGAAWGIFQLAATFPSISGDKDLLAEYKRWSIAWPYAVLQITTHAPDLHENAAKELFPQELVVYRAAPKGRQLVVQKLRSLVSRSSLSYGEFSAMSDMIEKGTSAQGVAIRIREQAMPYSIDKASSGFILIWCFLSPLCISSAGITLDLQWCGASVILIMALLLLCVDEVANQFNDPFDLLPGLNIASSNEKDIRRIEKELADISLASSEGLAETKRAAELDAQKSNAINITLI